MSTKILTGVYTSGYAIASSTTVLSITASGLIEGNGISAAAGAAPLIVNYGRVLGGVDDGLSLTGAGTVRNLGTIASRQTYVGGEENAVYLGDGGTVINGMSGKAIGYLLGYGTAVEIQGQAGTLLNYGSIFSVATGRSAVNLAAGGSVLNAGLIAASPNSYPYLVDGGAGVALSAGSVVNDGSIRGGAGGYGYRSGVGGADGGAGGDGVVASSGSVVNQGVVLGGVGGAGGVGFYSGGLGGNGVELSSGTVSNDGSIAGGAGGTGGYGLHPGGLGGGGGAGVQLSTGTLTNRGSIGGGAGGQGGKISRFALPGATGGLGGPGNAGVALLGASLANAGTIIGGAGGVGGAGYYRQGGAGGYGGAGVTLDGGSVSNTGTIRGGAGGAGGYGFTDDGANGRAGDGVDVTGVGGLVINGSAKVKTALIQGFRGVFGAGVADTIENFGTVAGADYGVLLAGGGILTNGSAKDRTATITGSGGVRLIGGATGVNYGVISATNLFGAVLGSGDYLTNGSAADARARISGGVYVYGDATVTNFGTIDGAGRDAVNFQAYHDTLVVEAGSKFIGGVYGGGGALDLASGVGEIGGLFAGGEVTVSGSMAATTFSAFSTLEVGAGASFSDARAVTIAAGQTVESAGVLTLGGGRGNSIANAGLIEVAGGGSLTLAGVLTNTGTLEVTGGTMVASRAVSGGGVAVIEGGLLDTQSTFTENVTFSSAGGELELARSQGYSGTITGFSATGATSLDLGDIGFVGAGEATYAIKTGVLTVTDGTHTAQIKLAGDYPASTFVASSDGHGGTLVVASKRMAPLAPPPDPTTASAEPFVAAMAALGAAPSASHPLPAPGWSPPEPILAHVRTTFA